MTKRVHNKREPFDVYIGRPSRWGNPYTHLPSAIASHQVATREEAVAKYREYVLARPQMVARIKRELKGKVLGCWCGPTQACHGDVLIEIAEGK